MKCRYCSHEQLERGYCCQQAELAVLRTVADEAIRMLEDEAGDQTIGSMDATAPMQLIADRLRRARTA